MLSRKEKTTGGRGRSKSKASSSSLAETGDSQQADKNQREGISPAPLTVPPRQMTVWPQPIEGSWLFYSRGNPECKLEPRANYRCQALP